MHERPSALSRRGWLGWASGLAVLPWPAQAAQRETRTLFGSPVDLLLPGAAPRAAAEDLFAGLARMNARWNAWKPGDLDDLNAALRAGRSHVTTPALASMIRSAATLERASDGCFNPAIGGLVGAWGFHADVMRAGSAPAESAIAAWTAARPSLSQLELRGLTVVASSRRVQLDFGAYAKGVALDWALERLARQGIRDALLNLGGNLAAMGTVDGRAWAVGIRDPHGPGLIASLAVHGREAVVTSGTYERVRVLDGRPCTHILDPLRGVPADGFDSVTVVHRSASLADAAATALLVAGPRQWQRMARRLGVDQVLVVDRAGRHAATAALAPRLHWRA
ncbi:MAG TPA: FAD:protein FMN transferase [Burkholderiaceae bacterium]|nr:FAD:protein FMN transferase [Burkholderiaceae bacterium]